MSRQKRCRRRLLLLLLLLLTVGNVVLLQLRIAPMLRKIAENQVVNAASEAIFRAVTRQLQTGSEMCIRDRDYTLETLTAMARGLRKTVRRKRSRRTHIFAGIVLVIGLASTVLSLSLLHISAFAAIQMLPSKH